jgi:hypothetical protein
MKSFALLLLFSTCISHTNGILQTAGLDVTLRNGTTYTLLVSQASFGSYPKMTPEKNEPFTNIMFPPSDNVLLCENVTSSPSKASSLEEKGLMLVGRGNCTFELKALNAQRLGASAVAVYGTLASRYTLNTTKYINHTDHVYTKDDIVYPQQYYDYDCSYGAGRNRCLGTGFHAPAVQCTAK